MYDDLNVYEKALANFGDRASIIAGLEISGKITQEEAHQQIKDLYKNLKQLRKKSSTWQSTGHILQSHNLNCFLFITIGIIFLNNC